MRTILTVTITAAFIFGMVGLGTVALYDATLKQIAILHTLDVSK